MGVAGGTASRGVLCSFVDEAGDENSDIRGVGLASTPSVLTSTPSFNTNVPPPRKASSKSISVRDTRRTSRADIGCKPEGYAEGGAGVRGALRNMEARVGSAQEAE